MINRMYKFKSGISQEEKNNKIREIKEIITQYPELNIDTQAYFDDDGTYVISVFEPSFMEKLRIPFKRQGSKTIQGERLYKDKQQVNAQKRYDNYR